jgi:hypothetical protein
MPDLDFQVEKVEPLAAAAAPTLMFKLRITNAEPERLPIRSLLLHCQIRIEPARRRYAAPEQEQLLDLFGRPEQWSRSLRSMVWSHSSMVVGPFTDSIAVDLPVPCSFDLTVAASKYFYALDGGEAPLSLLFSGSLFYETDDGRLQITQVPWDKEAAYRLPVQTWQQLMDLYYPNCAWICLRKDVFDRLYEYKSRRCLPTWERALESLLTVTEEQVKA